MTGPQSSQFVEHLRRAGHLKRTDERLDAAAPDQSQGNGTRNGPPTTNGKLWELTELSPNDLADEAARFYKLARISLQDMLQASSLAASFSPRFLRETLVFPFRTDDGVALAMADPADLAARRAAEIVLGPDIKVRIAAIDDLGTVLDQRLAEESAEAKADADGFSQLREDDIESLRDPASGAPVVRAVNDLLEKAVELRASDIHIEPFTTGLVVRMRIDGLLRPVTAPAGVLP